MEEKYEYMFFKYIYEKLKLKESVDKLSEEKVRLYDSKNVDKRISPYFGLLNRGSFEAFTEDEMNKVNELFSHEYEELLTEPLYSELTSFFDKTYKKYFFDNIRSNYTYYGPEEMEFLAPSDAITLSINYKRFDTEEEIFRKNEVLADMGNYIQEELAEKNNMKLAVIIYDEFSLNRGKTAQL